MTVRAIGPGANDWAVFAPWHGAVRLVFGPTSLYNAVQYKNRLCRQDAVRGLTINIALKRSH